LDKVISCALNNDKIFYTQSIDSFSLYES